MGKFAVYNIPLKSLSEGLHVFDFLLDKKYFNDINDGESDVKKGEVAVKLTVKKIASTFELVFELAGDVVVPCDRCLDDMCIEVATNSRIFVKFGKQYAEESDEVVIIPEDDGEINIAWFLYEFIALSIPMKKVHAPGKCNKMMSSKLNKYKATSVDDNDAEGGDDTNNDVEFEEETVSNSETDSRWDTLKGLNLED